MGLIGETLDSADNITGARVIDKSNISNGQINHRVEIWFRDFENEEFKSQLEANVQQLMANAGCVSTDISIQRNDCSKWKTAQIVLFTAGLYFTIHRNVCCGENTLINYHKGLSKIQYNHKTSGI